MAGRKTGPKQLSERDWIFGSRPRRLLLERAIAKRPRVDGWTKTELAKLAEVTANGGVDEHVAGMAAVGLLDERGGRWYVPTPRPHLAGALGRVLRLLSELSDEVDADPVSQRNESSQRSVDGTRATRRELRRARSAAESVQGLSEATRRDLLDALDRALQEVDL